MNALCRGSASRPRIDHRDSSSQLMTSGAVSNRARTLSGHSEVVDGNPPCSVQPCLPGSAGDQIDELSGAPHTRASPMKAARTPF
jgi:hypothetical protein